ncbi:hypothetical protein QJS10_CPA01g00336 [Acorus calamus]|uniref:Uncharacterized protein n=1 Tax=Acorus calamus TaxID=4465 RepID=A0AAV9FGN7_ACOCL|nr:hypothetical protein QJS10_CPA01g00336 [Acorus calamus]
MDEVTMITVKSAPPPPPPPPPPQKAVVIKSVTRAEIERFWRKKRMIEEDHLSAAIKASARIRARKLTEEDYRRFLESLESDGEKGEDGDGDGDGDKDDVKMEQRVGIKDWWTKSKYAYLNQPSVQSMDPSSKRRSTYIPNSCLHTATDPPKPFSCLGVF